MKKESRLHGLLLLIAKIGTKFAPFILKLLKSAKAIKAGLAIVSFASYAYLFTWKFAALIMVMLFVHESGHVWAMRRRNIKTKGFYFIPLIGGAAVPEESFRTRENEAYIAIMGPIWGLLLCIISAGVFFITYDPIWAASASWMALVNLFNLLPINPLDGGRIVKSVVLSAAYSEETDKVKKTPVKILGVSSLILAVVMIVFFKFWIFSIFAVIGTLEIINVLRSGSKQMVPMDKKHRVIHLTLFFVVAALLIAIMYSTAHVPGAKEALKFMKSK